MKKILVIFFAVLLVSMLTLPVFAGGQDEDSDGAVTFTTAVGTNFNINNTAHASGRTCGDAVRYSVSALTANTATTTVAPTSNCITTGDEVMLINLQGTGSYTQNIGNYEFLRVQGVVGSVVTFTTNKTKYYGSTTGSDSGLGTTDGTQRVMLMRVPNYTNVTIGS